MSTPVPEHLVFDYLLGFYPELMRPDQVAKALTCSIDHVANLREDGALIAIDIARNPAAGERRNEGDPRKLPTWRFYKSSVRDFLTSRPKNEAL